jgi:hypothetical protein
MQRDNTESRAYPCKCLTFVCLATTAVSNLRLPNNDSIRPNTSQYIWRIFSRYGFASESWSLTVREEQKLRVFENRVLRRIFGPKRDRVTGGWRKLHNGELHNLYSSPSIIGII